MPSVHTREPLPTHSHGSPNLQERRVTSLEADLVREAEEAARVQQGLEQRMVQMEAPGMLHPSPSPKPDADMDHKDEP